MKQLVSKHKNTQFDTREDYLMFMDENAKFEIKFKQLEHGAQTYVILDNEGECLESTTYGVSESLIGRFFNIKCLSVGQPIRLFDDWIVGGEQGREMKLYVIESIEELK